MYDPNFMGIVALEICLIKILIIYYYSMLMSHTLYTDLCLINLPAAQPHHTLMSVMRKFISKQEFICLLQHSHTTIERVVYSL